MKLYKLRLFAKWAKKEGISDLVLKQAIVEIEQGLYDASLGSMLFKKRISRKGQGRRGGFRTLLAFKRNDRVFFLYGFAKNVQENISSKDEESLKKLASHYLNVSQTIMDKALKLGELEEII